MNAVYEAFDILKSYAYLGENKFDDGTLLIGKAPHIAPQAWLHCIYPPLSKEEMDRLEDRLGVPLPEDYRRFLQVSNGLNVFNTTFNVYGLRRDYNRDVEAVRLPFDIVVPNGIERPENAKPSYFMFGGYDWDGSKLYLDTETNKVHLCGPDDAKSLFQWDSFAEMLKSEVKRLVGLFDKKGRELDEEESTLPV